MKFFVPEFDGKIELTCIDNLEIPINFPIEGGARAHVGVLVDLETTGTDPEKDTITEIAYKKFLYTDDGYIVNIQCFYSSLEETEVIPEDVQQVTGITPEMTKGHHINWKLVLNELKSSDLILAHNAKFEYSFLTRKLPELEDSNWGCSMDCIPWHDFGFISRRLEILLCQNGLYYHAHRALPDVHANLYLLAIFNPHGEPFLKNLLEDLAKPYHRISVSNCFNEKDFLKAAGYYWNNQNKTWQTKTSDIESQKNFLQELNLLDSTKITKLENKDRFK